jgi:phosphoribosylformylglycinamidine cyclo-ligase
VRHCCNDVAVLGATPLFFLDYLATGRLAADVLAGLVEGMAAACCDEGVALLGGETAEMPGFYAEGEYDCAGFVVGIADRARLVDGKRIRAGDRLVGFPSAGLHTNGYSLARRIVAETPALALDARPQELAGATVAQALLAPHVSYTREIRRLLDDPAADAKGFAHITGGGIGGNLGRILPKDVDARVRRRSWSEPSVFDLLRRAGRVPEEDMRRTFNLGIGLIAVVGGRAPIGLEIGDVVPGTGRVSWVD